MIYQIKLFMNQYNKVLKWNDILLPDVVLISVFIGKSIKMFINVNFTWTAIISLLMSSIYIFLIVRVLRGKKKYVILKNVSFLMQNIWAILDVLVWIMSIVNIYSYSGWKNMAIYISTLVVIVSYVFLQIYLYANNKMVFKN